MIGLLLSATAIAKLWMLLTDSFADIRVGLPKEILWLSVGFELWLAFENFRVRDHRVLSLVNTVVFGFFAIFASVRWLLGYSSCGCSGNIELPAWLFILIDLGIIGWFTLPLNQLQKVCEGTAELKKYWIGCSAPLKGRIVGASLFALIICSLQLPFAMFFKEAMFGQSQIRAEVSVQDTLVLNQNALCRVEIWNQSRYTARVIGVTRSCTCVNLDRVLGGQIVNPNSSLVIPITLRPDKVGQLHQRVVIFIEHPHQNRINVELRGFVSAPSEKNEKVVLNYGSTLTERKNESLFD